MEARLIKIRGDVQGVSYRYFAKKQAKELGLAGWTKNEQDGSVTAFIQGNAEKLEKFIEWANEGSPMATVENVAVNTVATDESIRSFEVR